MDEVLQEYYKNFAFLSPDPLCPEIRMWNLKDLHSFWKFSSSKGHEDIPYWAIVWPGGRALARYILDNPEMIEGKNVLDFASGNGIVGVSAKLAGARRVSILDTDPLALESAKESAEVNHVAIETSSVASEMEEEFMKFDLVFAGDIFYEEELAKNSLIWMQKASREKTRCIVADPQRNHRPGSGTETLKTYLVPVYKEVEGISTRVVDILKILAAP